MSDTQARLIDGRARAAQLKSDVAAGVAGFRAATGRPPRLDVVLVGEDPASQIYVRNKEQEARDVGMTSAAHRLSGDVAADHVEALVRTLSDDEAVDGVLLQLPLPGRLDPAGLISALDPAKDVDGLTTANAGRLVSGVPALVPCTPRGCMMLIRECGVDLAGRRALVVGRSHLMGRPMAELLLQADCTVTIAHSKSLSLPALCQEADILVAAVGRPEFIRGDWIRKGAIVIDVGVNRAPSRDPAKAAAGKTRLVGDVAFDEAVAVAAAITPVPGGVGPMTIACLLENTLIAARRRAGLDGV